MLVSSNTIELDTRTKRRIVELSGKAKLLVAHRNYHFRLLATILYGVAIGAGYLLVMGIIKTNWFDLAPLLFWLVAISWLSAELVSKVWTRQPIKIRIK